MISLELFRPGLTLQQVVTRWLYLLGAILFLLSGGLWWNKIYHNPERVFWGMVDRSLATSAVTRTVAQEADGQKLEQIIQVQTGGKDVSRSLTTLTQGTTVVITEALATPTTDYVRYNSFKTDQKSKTGKAFDFSKVLGVWAKSSGQGQAQFFNQAVFGLVPQGYVDTDTRKVIVDSVKRSVVYTTDFSKAKRATVNGRDAYVYNVDIHPVAYVQFLKTFGAAIGVDQFKDINPGDYAGSQAQTVEMAVDIASHHLLRISVSSPDTARTETYGSYGVRVAASEPTKAITTSELQQRLQSVQ